jgi:hypothetical protein
LKNLPYFCAVIQKNKDMEATMTHPPLNDTQMFVLRTFATARSEQEREELTSFYLDYIQRKLDAATDRWWEENEMTPEKFNEVTKDLHFRTPYR